MTRILIVEDEESYREPLVYQLTREGYDVSAAATGEEGLELFTKGGIDLVLLDLMLPGLDGTALCRRIREQSRVPIIMLTAKSAEIDKVVGLEIGADDYITKPYSFRELLARVRAVLRRAQPVQAERKEPEEDGVVRVRGLWMDRKSMKARMDGVPMDLTALEFRILFGMAAHPGRVFTRENLLELAVGREFSRYDRSVDMHISTLRRKLGDDPHNPAYLKTIRGMGYTLLPEEA